MGGVVNIVMGVKKSDMSQKFTEMCGCFNYFGRHSGIRQLQKKAVYLVKSLHKRFSFHIIHNNRGLQYFPHKIRTSPLNSNLVLERDFCCIHELPVNSYIYAFI